ncbi:MAG TPA: carbohydrate ABC transporter permease [Chthoniobacterales bacterium]|jgi:multiple sugar transport system permease protein|nr:carbohydrate ABC transporter permease [Chthoniobacterales bacterium]
MSTTESSLHGTAGFGPTSLRAGPQLASRIFLIAASLFYISPLYWMLVTAFKSDKELAGFPPTLWPQEMVWRNFDQATRTFPFPAYLGNTIFYAGLVMLGSVLSNFLIAYGFSRIKWPGRDLLFYPVIASIFIFCQFPVNPITMVPMFSFFARLGLVDSYLPLILPAFFGNPFFIFLLRQFMLQIPDNLSEAARIDGANEFQIMHRIILPLTRPALVVVALLAGVNAWNDFLGPLIYLQSDRLYTLSLGLTFFKTSHAIQFNLLMAASCLVVLPVVLVFLFFQRVFLEGITLGSGK